MLLTNDLDFFKFFSKKIWNSILVMGATFSPQRRLNYIYRILIFPLYYNIDPAHWEIISRPDPLSGSGFHSIYPDPPRGAPDPPSSAPTGSGSALIQTQASFQIGIHVWVLRPDLDFCLSTQTGSCLALIHARASLLIWIFVWVLRLDLVCSDLCPSQLPDLDLCLSTRTRSRLAPLHARARCQIQIFV